MAPSGRSVSTSEPTVVTPESSLSLRIQCEQLRPCRARDTVVGNLGELAIRAQAQARLHAAVAEHPSCHGRLATLLGEVAEVTVHTLSSLQWRRSHLTEQNEPRIPAHLVRQLE